MRDKRLIVGLLAVNNIDFYPNTDHYYHQLKFYSNSVATIILMLILTIFIRFISCVSRNVICALC
jgi:hypothetical protein